MITENYSAWEGKEAVFAWQDIMKMARVARFVLNAFLTATYVKTAIVAKFATKLKDTLLKVTEHVIIVD